MQFLKLLKKKAGKKKAGKRKGNGKKSKLKATVKKKKVQTSKPRTVMSRDQIEFIDIGGSKGGSFLHVQKKFGYSNGLAVDIDPSKVKQSLKRGVPMICLDASNMKIFSDNASKMVTMIHFLEHLPSLSIVRKILFQACRVAQERVYIRGPMFYDSYLKSFGLRFNWAHWTGHTCHVEENEIINFMKEFGQTNYVLKYHGRVKDSKNSSILPRTAPIDSFDYNPKKHGKKPYKIFDKPIYKEFELLYVLPQNT